MKQSSKDSFQEVLTKAIADLVEHGYDSAERIERWTRELRVAAERSMISAASLDQQLRDALAAIYRRMVDQGGLLKYNPGVERYAIDRVRPALRAELDRRIMASANLIKLNRNEAINSTLRRFQGWSTSLPPGGVSAETRAETKAKVRKSLAQLPFEERRVLIDQGHKLTAAINEIVATDGGAIAGRWRSHWRQAGYNYREEHKERDEQVYLVRDSWADQAGLVKKGGNPYYDEIEAVGQLPFCRCYMTWLYNLRDLPADMLTAKGKAALTGARRQASGARADEAEPAYFAGVSGLSDDSREAFAEAQGLDALSYLSGIKHVRTTPDTSEWNARYDPDRDEIVIQAKFEAKDHADKVQTLLHEAGHRGQSVDAQTYESFKRAHLNRLSSFLEMANRVHLEDFDRRGEVDSVAAEVFAESYARAMMRLPTPADLAAFWGAGLGEVDGPSSQKAAEYTPVWPNKITRCQRCTMFLRVNADPTNNACTAVAGRINAHGHCKLFDIGHGRADATEECPRPVIGAEAVRVRLSRLRENLAAHDAAQ